jgi:hypothetical protein
MTKAKSTYRRTKRGRPGYDSLAIYAKFEADRRRAGKSVNAMVKDYVLVLADAGLPAAGWPVLTGEPLRHYIQAFKHDHIANAGPPMVAMVEKLIADQLALIHP